MFEINNFVTAGKFFLIIAGELIGIFVAVAFIIGLLLEYLPPARIKRLLTGRMLGMQYFLGALLGSVTPFCSCSTVPILSGLLKGGVPFGPVLAFLFASPVLNPIIVSLFMMLLGFKVTAVYVVVTFIGSMLTAALLSKLGLEKDVKPLAVVRADCGCGTPPAPVPADVPATAAGGCCFCSGGDGTTGTQAGQTAGCRSVDLDADLPESVPFTVRMKHAAAEAVSTFKGVFWYLMIGACIGAFIYGFFPQDLVVRVAGSG
ncbi:MAG: permease, partial [Kiritimatiellae bacterium]|nr:permease [Kiritimatiellia bacterium]